MLNKFSNFLKSICLAGLTASLCACAVMDETGLRGASSMTVDVEVYKGPLSKTREVQIAELLAIVRDAESTFWNIRRRNQLSLVENECESVNKFYTSKTSVSLHKEVLELRRNFLFNYRSKDVKKSIDELGDNYGSCLLFTIIEYDSEELFIALDQLSPEAQKSDITADLQSDQTEKSGKNFQILSVDNQHAIGEACIYNVKANDEACLNELYQIARVGGHLRARADFWGTISSTTAISDRSALRRTADMAHFASEYGNQIISRADALIRLSEEGKGTGLNGIELAKLLSTSYYLRDSSTTNFLKLYDWNRAGSSAGGRLTGLSRADRVRMVEMLINDNHWSNINSVYASGQGEVSMAFIKDDIGNWNLKSFANDPAKLLKAYDDFSFDLVRKAAALATNANNVSDALSLLNLSQSAQSGTGLVKNTQGIADIKVFRDDFKKKVAAENERVAEKLTNLQTNISNSAQLIRTSSLSKSIAAREFQKDVTAADVELGKLKASFRSGCPDEAIAGAPTALPICTSILADSKPSDLCTNADVKDSPMVIAQCELRQSAETKAKGALDGSLLFEVEFVCANDIDQRTQLHASCAKHVAALAEQKEMRIQSVQNLKLMVSNYKAIIDAFQLSSARR